MVLDTIPTQKEEMLLHIKSEVTVIADNIYQDNQDEELELSPTKKS